MRKADAKCRQWPTQLLQTLFRWGDSTNNNHVRMRGSAMDQDIRGVAPLQAQRCQPLTPLQPPLEPPLEQTAGTRAEFKPELDGRHRQLQAVARTAV